MSDIDSIEVGGKALADWDQMWVPLKGGATVYHAELRGRVGLYRFKLQGQVMAIGVATEQPGGLAKRLSDFRRDSSSARDHHMGRLINLHLHDLTAEVLITGSGSEGAALATQLTKAMVERHKPVWNCSKAACEEARAKRRIQRVSPPRSGTPKSASLDPKAIILPAAPR